MDSEKSRCTSGCTSETDSVHETPDMSRIPAGGGLGGRLLAEAIAAVQRLPLSDDEKAEAIRRLLDR